MRAPVRSILAMSWWGALWLAGCARGPALTSVEDDIRLGEKVAAAVEEQMGLVSDAAMTAYIDQVGQRVAGHVKNPRFPYTFQVVDQDASNAFSIPGGHIYVSRGLLALLMSQDELANVLGHEIVHVEGRHAARRQTAAILPGILSIPGNVVGAVVDEDLGGLLTRPVQRLGAAYLAGYSREQEYAADREGQELSARAGFDPAGMPAFLDRLDAQVHLREGASRLPGFFDTHPATPDRVAIASQRAAAIAWSRSIGITSDRADFLRRFDGLLVGPNPAEGLFRGRLFLHPDMNFKLEIPDGWLGVNTRQAVAAIAPNQEALLLLTAPVAGDDPKKAADAFVQPIVQRGGTLARSEKVTINGLAAHAVSVDGGTPRDPMRLEAVWIAYDKAIFPIIGVAPPAKATLLRKAAQTFAPMDDDDRRGIRELRLRLVAAQPGETLAQLGQRVGNAWDVKRTAVTNGLPAGAALGEGQLVKVALPQRYKGRPGPTP